MCEHAGSRWQGGGGRAAPLLSGGPSHVKTTSAVALTTNRPPSRPQGSAYPYRSRVWLLNGMASPPTPVAEAAPAELLEEVVELNHQFLR